MTAERVCVVGLGYIGLPTAAFMAEQGLQVIGVDVNRDLVAGLNRGEAPPSAKTEPGLEDMVRRATASGRFRAADKPEEAEVFVIVVPTPFVDEENHEADLSFIKSAAESLAGKLKKGDLVILESTSPVGTTEKMAAWLKEARPDLTFPGEGGGPAEVFVAYCPERILPGQALKELAENSRVAGGLDADSAARAKKFYGCFVKGEIMETNARTAEMVKLTENAFRDVNIAFANELSLICDRLDINAWELIDLANRHPRVNILKPGPGVGGHCIAVDPWFIVSRTPDLARLTGTARRINDHKPDWVIEQVLAARDEILAAEPDKKENDLSVAVLGLAFKPDIDDLRESPALAIAARLSRESSLKLRLVEPNIETAPPALNGQSLYSIEQALDGADIALLLVNHKEFRAHGPLTGSYKTIDCVGLTTTGKLSAGNICRSA